MNIASVFGVVKVVQLLVIYWTPAPFDTSSQLLLSNYEDSRRLLVQLAPPAARALASHLVLILDKLVVWDAVYFTNLFVEDIRYEHQFVFCPLWWRAFHSLHTHFYAALSISVLVSNILHLCNVYLVYFLTKRVFSTSFFTHDFAHHLAIAYILSPAAAFLTAPYSENACAFAALLGLYLREVSLRHDFAGGYSIASYPAYLASGVLFLVSLGFRANALLLGTVFLYDLHAFLKNKRHHNALASLVGGSILFVLFVISSLYPYTVFCGTETSPPWCHQTIPSLFTYAQKHYWNNGFLHYWSPNNIPNFLFAMPSLVLSGVAARLFLVEFPVGRAVPTLLVNTLTAGGALLFWHVQIFTRIASLTPVVAWAVAALYTSRHRRSGTAALYFLIVWNVVQTSLFAAFLPPA